jgi:hypothetical protein
LVPNALNLEARIEEVALCVLHSSYHHPLQRGQRPFSSKYNPGKQLSVDELNINAARAVGD